MNQNCLIEKELNMADKTYESVEYSEDENRIKMAKMLVSAPEIKVNWMKMHSDYSEA